MGFQLDDRLTQGFLAGVVRMGSGSGLHFADVWRMNLFV